LRRKCAGARHFPKSNAPAHQRPPKLLTIFLSSPKQIPLDNAERRRVYQDWLRQHAAIFFKVVRAYARTVEDQEDLFQDILLQVWRSVSAFRHEASASTWLYRIALNVAIKWRTKENRRLEETSNSSLLLPGKNYQNPQLEWLYQAIHRLPKIDRSLILLHLDGFPHAEIGSITGMSTTNVGTRLHRIKQQLATAARQTKAHEL
jgi:RNA polymerase sigma-70 factor (ECF subfamily)